MKASDAAQFEKLSAPTASVPGCGTAGLPKAAPRLSVRIRAKSFQTEKGTKEIIRDVRFDVAPGEIFTILGPSGSGKTTILRIIAGLDLDFDGDVLVAGSRMTGPGRDRGVMFQESRLLPWRRAESNVDFALPREIEDPERARRTNEMLELVGLSDARSA